MEMLKSKSGRLKLFVSVAVISFASMLLYPKAMNYRYEMALDEEADRIVNNMSRRDLIGQVIHLSVPGKDANSPAVRRELENIRPGGVILFGYNIGTGTELKSFISTLQKTAAEIKIPDLFISTDQEGGRVIRVKEPITQFPSALSLGQANRPELAERVGFQLSHELRSIGINMFFAPVLDINNNPDNPVIGTRSFGSNMTVVMKNAVAFERGARQGGSVPVIKHFPGHGNTNVDSHLGLPVIHSNLKSLEEFELKTFEKAITSGSDAVMSAHILFPEIDEKYPATLSNKILYRILRNRLGFKGLILTDAMEMKAIYDNFRNDQPGVRAIMAGADVLLLTSWDAEPKRYLQELIKADENGEFVIEGRDWLKQAVRRQIRLKLQYGLLSGQWTQNQVLIDREIEKHDRRRKAREKLSGEYPDLNKTVSQFAIKTLRHPQEFPLPGDCSIQTYSGVLAPLNRNSSSKCIIQEAGSSSALKALNERARANKELKVIALYKGSPFEYTPSAENMQVIYSFSPTLESVRALGRALEPAVYRELGKMNLIIRQP